MGSSENIPFMLLLLLLGFFLIMGSQCTNSSANFSQSCHPDDLTALNGFIDSLQSAPSNWGGDKLDCCSWKGITCQVHQRVIGLELPGNKLAGKLSGALSGLVNLKTLNLSNNYLFGSAPTDLFRFPNLLFLDLSHNQFSGSLPPGISLPKIRILDLSDNSFVGVLKWDISEISTSLEVFDLSLNYFSGEIPTGFGNCNLLNKLSLAANYFVGNPPKDVFWLQGMTRLDLSDNELSATLTPDFGNLTSLIHLDISSNNFSGQIPDNFQCLKNLKLFFANSNRLSGNLPMSLVNSPSISSLNVNNNSLSGSISVVNCSAMQSLTYLNLGSNNFVGPIPDSLSLCRRLQVLLLARTRLNSQIPESFKDLKSLTTLSVFRSNISNLSSALSILQLCENLTSLILTANFKNEAMPIDSGLRFSNVKTLVIANCGLTGSIPYWLSRSSNLQLLDLSWNRLTGEIPSWFNSLNFIFYLDLSNNSFNGQIPESLTELRGLKYRNSSVIASSTRLDLPLLLKTNQSLLARQYNKLSSFPTTLDLSYNKFVGQILINFGQLRALQVFDLSHNMLSGDIPSNLSKMASLETLNLSYNNLSGSIPLSFQVLNFLSNFNVAYNFLTGRIPTRGQFSTFPDSSFEGNPGLCMKPSCGGSVGKEPTNKSVNEEGGGDFEADSIFGLQFGIGVILGFIVTVVVKLVLIPPKEKKRKCPPNYFLIR